MKGELTVEDFFNDDGHRFLRIGELQLIKERLQACRGRTVDDSILDDLEGIIKRMENTCALLYSLIERL